MNAMSEIIDSVFAAPLTSIFIIAGMIFLFIAVAGNISGKIEPGVNGRIFSGILGIAFIITGIALLTQKIPQTSITSEKVQEENKSFEHLEKPSLSSIIIKPNQKLETTALQHSDSNDADTSNNQSVETIFEGVIANLTRFEKTGELVTLEFTFHNTAPKEALICADELESWHSTKIINELTGEYWSVAYYGGSISCNNKIRLSKEESHVVWMKFKIKNPEMGKFTFSWHILKKPIENIILELKN